MVDDPQSQHVIEQLTAWAQRQASVRAVLLTSTRANPTAHLDWLSDYDVVLVVRDIHPFFEDRRWLDAFGRVLVSYWDDIHPEPDSGIEKVGNVIQYEDVRIDFTLWPIELLNEIVDSPKLPAELDVGYRVLLDKDELTHRLASPTFRAYIPKPPDAAAFRKVVEDFLSVAPHVAKCLWRDELLPAKWCLDYDMKHNFLRRVLEWRVEMEHDWSIPTGSLGRGLKKGLPADLWARVEETYAGADIVENWDALLATLSVFRLVASEVAEHLGAAYPEGIHRDVVAYLLRVRQAKK